MTQEIKIFNEFGFIPTTNFEAAGSDFYLPYFDEDKKEVAFEAFKQSYRVNDDEINNVIVALDFYMKDKNLSNKQKFNIVHLYLGLQSAALESYGGDSAQKIKLFIDRYLVFDNNGTPGVKMELNDHIKINSGVHVGLYPGTAGIFFNKSGKGTAGFDVRAQVVDEDYTGFVHLSLAFTKDTETTDGIIYCGDKLTQMVILPVIKMIPLSVGKDEYFELMSNSKRGSNSFGSSDEKH